MKRVFAVLLCVCLLLSMAAVASAAEGDKVTGVKVVDGTDGYTEVTSPVAGQKLTANIQTSKGEIGSYPVNADATYKWYYKRLRRGSGHLGDLHRHGR